MRAAKIILEQLGGGRFLAMTGAKNLVGGEGALRFDLPKSHKMRISLTAADLYKLEYWKWARGKLELVLLEESDGIFNDMLQAEFTRITGLHTRL